MYFTSGSDRAFEQLMQGKPGFDHYDSGEAVTPEDCGTCRFYRPRRSRRRTAAPAAFIARTGNINSASMRNVLTSRAS